jgi:hypothetical protein
MRACPNCGYNNADDAETCLRCDYQLLEPLDAVQPPTTAPAPQTPLPLAAAQGQNTRRKRSQYWLGLALGLIPLIIFFLGLGLLFQPPASNVAGTLIIASLVLYLVSLIAMIVCLSIGRVRFVGYGLLTAVAASPVIAFISCVVVLTRIG